MSNRIHGVLHTEAAAVHEAYEHFAPIRPDEPLGHLYVAVGDAAAVLVGWTSTICRDEVYRMLKHDLPAYRERP